MPKPQCPFKVFLCNKRADYDAVRVCLTEMFALGYRLSEY
jgi:hypothetical protein